MFHFTELVGERVKLVPLDFAHIEPLYDCAKFPEIWSNYPMKVQSFDDMKRFVVKALEARERKEQFPFAIYDREQNRFVGSTRFLRISEAHNNLNIGSTWYTPAVWRTRVNTETKYLMLQYAFESLSVVRVEIITTTDNLRSQTAIERMGAKKEGVLRKKYNNLDYVTYSILIDEWPEIRLKLEGFLGERRS